MYSRYTSFHFDEANRKAVLDFWENVGVPSAGRQEGWRGGLIVESVETPGKLWTVTLWESEEDFDRYYASDEHQELGAGIRNSGLKVEDRDGLNVLSDARPKGGALRITRARVKPDRIGEVEAYWRSTGCSLVRRQPACLRADAYWDSGSDDFVLVLEWRAVSDAERFIASDEHREFAAGLDDAIGEIVDRQMLRLIS